ncbi:aspartic peptidase domain-containing protein [Talaromyces proteolyticus]|uniref:Aspartic peptidase domain-containing protein n=1 Tax=Talaromyces proteolyticus TaxID=1131652 RepID=A0AAD4PX42_9EURO|nr:aspartic peptidase domain-containing protein [Talaromyces proteolyticus]KAH8698922.1 aspartic peptidase domain-containing protein [Talaromyces proteolyticus]
MLIFQFLVNVVYVSVAATTLPLNRRNALVQSYKNTSSSLIATEFGSVFDVDVSLSNQTFKLLVDTGSSDTYVMKTGYQCISLNNSELLQADCLYSSKTYNISDTYREIPNVTFGVQYGAGIASGVMAYEDVSLGGITVKGQKVGIANRSNPMGDGLNSGLLGLGYPSLTSAHPGRSVDNTTYFFNRLVYNPLFTNMYQQGLVEPFFSLALARTPQNSSNGFGGYLSLGELPPVPHSPNFAAVPVEITKNIPLSFTSGKRVRSYWSMTVSGVIYGPSREGGNDRHKSLLTINSTSLQAFVDSGNFFTMLPAAIVDPINALFFPPAIYSESQGAYIVDCSAQAPTFGIQIGNQTFFHRGADLIYQTADGVCVSSLISSESVSLDGVQLNILGDSFLKNVVAVFDFGKNEMRFAKQLDEPIGYFAWKNRFGKDDASERLT